MIRREVLQSTVAVTGALVLADEAEAASQVISAERPKRGAIATYGTAEDRFQVSLEPNEFGCVTLECEDSKATFAPAYFPYDFSGKEGRNYRMAVITLILKEWFRKNPGDNLRVHVAPLKDGAPLIPDSDPYFAIEGLKYSAIIDRAICVAYNERRAPYRAAFRDHLQTLPLMGEPVNSPLIGEYLRRPEVIEMQGYNLPKHDRIRLVIRPGCEQTT